MIEFKKMCTSIAENSRNLSAHRIIEISSVIRNTHVLLRNQDKFVFYINNYIDWDHFNQLYDPDQIEKVIKNADAVACKLRLASIKATNNRLEVAKKKGRKREEIMERRKAEAMAAKWRRVKGEISFFDKEKDENDTGSRPSRSGLNQ